MIYTFAINAMTLRKNPTRLEKWISEPAQKHSWESPEQYRARVAKQNKKK